VRTKTVEQKDKILAAAAQLFGTQRFHQVRMDDIAEIAAVGKGTLYRYFQDKEELYLAVLARSSDQFIERIRDAIESVDGLRAQLEVLAATLVAYFDEQPHLLDLIQRSEVESTTGIDFPWYGARLELMRIGTDLFAQAKARGEHCIRTPDLAMLLFFGGLRSVIWLGVKPRPRHLARQYVDLFLFGADENQVRRSQRPVPAHALLR
jgi:AcrR family transcriptional regulator